MSATDRRRARPTRPPEQASAPATSHPQRAAAALAAALITACITPLWAPPAHAQGEPQSAGDTPSADDTASDAPAKDAAPAADAAAPVDPASIERPRLVRDAKPAYPPEAYRDQLEADVVVLLTVDVDGRVEEVALDRAAGHGFDEQALKAARLLRFTPARIAGTPTPIQIRYTFRFRIPEKETVARTIDKSCGDAPACPVDEREAITLRATVFERGRGKILAGVEVYLLDRDEVILTDDQGQFEIKGPPGAYALVIRPPGFYPFEATERLEAGETAVLKYYVRRNRRSRYSTIVWGSEGRAEVARTSLVDDEIRTIPGTMGDPIRVAMLMPGVSSSASGLGYPIVRGALPGDSLYEIDGIKVPMLYHLLFGNAVIHGRFIDEISFQPGGYSAEHGRSPGGRIGATTAKVREDPLLVADLSIIETSLFRSQKLGENSEVVAAARYGTLGYIIEGLAANTVFRYWDYQLRLGHHFDGAGKLTLTVFGAQDAVGEQIPETGREEILELGFHTADLRYRDAIGAGWLQAGVQGGWEFFRPPVVSNGGDDNPDEDDDDLGGSARMWKVRPYVEVGYEPSAALTLKAGADFLYQDFGLELSEEDMGDVFLNTDDGLTFGAFAAAEWSYGRLLLAPSLRLDHYRYRAADRTDVATSLQPRAAAVFEAHEDVLLKASGGLYTGPSRFSFVAPPIVFGPIPGYEGPGLYNGLNKSWQGQVGVETKLPGDFELAVTGFYHDLFQPIDFSLIDRPLVPDPIACNGVNDAEAVTPLDIDGKSYGAELMLRRRLGNSAFGWISYSVARSERTIDGVGTIPFDYDQTHVLNAVASWEVGRNWTLGAVFHFNTGRPIAAVIVDRCQLDDQAGGIQYYEARAGAPNAERLPYYWRIDARIQKREVFDTWFFDFYIDFFNASFQWEVISYDIDFETGQKVEENVPLFLPMIGIRGEF